MRNKANVLENYFRSVELFILNACTVVTEVFAVDLTIKEMQFTAPQPSVEKRMCQTHRYIKCFHIRGVSPFLSDA